jgi:hypothetical protein
VCRDHTAKHTAIPWSTSLTSRAAPGRDRTRNRVVLQLVTSLPIPRPRYWHQAAQAGHVRHEYNSQVIDFGRRPDRCILIEVIDSGSAMGLHWFRGPEIVVEVSGGEILVTMPGTSLSVVYEKTDDNHLIANSFSARKDEKRKVSLPKFLALAWTAANEKAKEIGWIA